MPNNDHNINTVSIEHSTGKHDKRRPPPCSWALNTFLMKTELTACHVVTRLFLFLLLSLQVWVVLVLEHGLDISSYQSQEAYEEKLVKKGYSKITTEIRPAGEYYYAEDYHQQYLAKNPGGYCGMGGTGVSCPIGTGVEK